MVAGVIISGVYVGDKLSPFSDATNPAASVAGINTFDMAFPAVLCHYCFRSWLGKAGVVRIAGAFCCGAVSVAGAAVCTALALAFANEGFVTSARILLVAHLPVMLLEGCIVALMVSYIAKNKPELLHFTQ